MVNRKGQYSIIAALLVSAVLITTFIVTYSMIRENPISDQPQTMSAVDETNFAIKQILGFTVGYYGSVLEVTGNRTYANSSTVAYAQDGLKQVAGLHPEWGTSLSLSTTSPLQIGTYWYCNESYSSGQMTVSYNLTKLGISGVTYQPTCKLSVQVVRNAPSGQAYLNVTQDDNGPTMNLHSQNFMFYNYTTASTWVQVNPSIEPAFGNGIYSMNVSQGIDSQSYVVEVQDQRGIKVIASSTNQYTITPMWNSTFAPTSNSTIVIELLQNGTMKWLGQPLEPAPGNRTLPIPPIPIKALRVNETINGVNQQIPFQIEDWGAEYQIPLALTSNASLFNSRNMIVFLTTPNVSKVTIWWNGSDTCTQTPFAYENRYFTKDDNQNGVLTNGNLTLILQGTQYLYVDNFDSTNTSWTEVGDPPYLNDNSTNYIYHYVDKQSEGWFGFQNLTEAQSIALGALASAKIEFECYRSDTDDQFNFTVNDGIKEYGPYTITPPNSNFDWVSNDITSKVNSSTQINNLRLSVTYKKGGSSASNVYIRRSRINLNLGGWLTSLVGNSTSKADFMYINDKAPSYGSNLAYIIDHGVVRDIIHQEAEWSSGISEYLYVDSYNSSSTQWTCIGASPYLHDDDSSMIYNNSNGKVIGWFSFQNLSRSLNNANVKIQFECNITGDGDDYFQFVIYDGTQTYGPYNITGLPGTAFDYREYDVSSILNTTQKINNAKVRITYKLNAGSASTIFIRRCRLYVVTCPNVYSEIVVTLPANVTYYTYQLRLNFVDSQWNRTTAILCPISVTTLLAGGVQTENGTDVNGYPIVSNATAFFFNYSTPQGWKHHWSQIVLGDKGIGIMFTDNANYKLYAFDGKAGANTGGIKPNATVGTIELDPAYLVPAFFKEKYDVTWCGAVVTFDQTLPVYKKTGGIGMGLWVLVEYPPKIAVRTGD